MDDLQANLLLERLHAADLLKGDARPFDSSLGGNGCVLLVSAKSSFHHVARVGISVDAEALGEIGVGQRGVGVDCLAVLADGSLHVAGPHEQTGVQQIGAGRRVALA